MEAKLAKQLIFIGVVLLVVAFIYSLIYYAQFLRENIILIAILGIIVFLFWKYDFLIMLKEYERAVIFRFGKVHRVGGPGWTIIFPPIESYVKVDLRTTTLDVPRQDVVTKDNIEVRIDAIIYLKVKSDKASVINSVIAVDNYKEAAKLFVVASIRDIAGSMRLSDLIGNVRTLNDTISERLAKMAEKWGVSCEAVEIKDIQIPKTVIEAMHLEKAAEQEKLARMERAKAHQAEIDAVREAAEHLSDKALSYYYIRALEKIGEGKSTKFIFPMEIIQLAQLLAGKMGNNTASQLSQQDIEKLIQQYGPILAEYLKKEKERREKKKG